MLRVSDLELELVDVDGAVGNLEDGTLVWGGLEVDLSGDTLASNDNICQSLVLEL